MELCSINLLIHRTKKLKWVGRSNRIFPFSMSRKMSTDQRLPLVSSMKQKVFQPRIFFHDPQKWSYWSAALKSVFLLTYFPDNHNKLPQAIQSQSRLRDISQFYLNQILAVLLLYPTKVVVCIRPVPQSHNAMLLSQRARYCHAEKSKNPDCIAAISE